MLHELRLSRLLVCARFVSSAESCAQWEPLVFMRGREANSEATAELEGGGPLPLRLPLPRDMRDWLRCCWPAASAASTGCSAESAVRRRNTSSSVVMFKPWLDMPRSSMCASSSRNKAGNLPAALSGSTNDASESERSGKATCRGP